MIQVDSITHLGKLLLSEDIYKDNGLLLSIIKESSYSPLLDYIYNKYDMSKVFPESDDEEVISRFRNSFDEYLLDILVDDDKKINFIYDLKTYFSNRLNLEIDPILSNIYDNNKDINILINISLDDILNIQELEVISIEDVVFVSKKGNSYSIDRDVPVHVTEVKVLWDTENIIVYNKKLKKINSINTYILVDTYLKYFLLTGIVLFISQKNIMLSILFMVLKFISSKILFKDKQNILHRIDIITYIVAIITGMLSIYVLNANIVLKYE